MAEEIKERPLRIVREAVAAFADKGNLRAAVSALLAAGFKPTDFSLLASHDSLEVAGDVPGYPGKPGDNLLAGLTDQVRFLAPLTIAGFALISGGPVAVALAAVAGAGLGGVAIKELLDYAAANRHSAAFAKALEQGSVLLWVAVAEPALEPTAVRLLEEAGGKDAHINARKLSPAE